MISTLFSDSISIADQILREILPRGVEQSE
jgi:hypothetical protein